MDNVELTTDSNSGQNLMDQDRSHTQISTSYHFISNMILALMLLAVSSKILHRESYLKALIDTVSTVTFIVIVFGITELCLRIYHFFVEILQINSKYGGDIGKVFKALNLNTATWIVLAVSFSTFLILYITAGNTFEYLWKLGPLVCIPAFVCSVVVCQLVDMRESKLNQSELISSMNGVDYGTGMAFSYFYGYLKIILPDDGSNKGLRFKMEQYEAEQNVTIPIKKLFILIPKSAHIPPDLKEASYNWLESTTNLENEVRNRAGVKSRKYRNTIYKIHPGGDEKKHRPIYVATEGASPMLTLYEILQHSHPQTAIYREHRDQIIDAFCTTLQTLINNDPQCTNVCELVIYNDYDAEGKLKNVGEILLKRIAAQVGYSV